MDGWGGTLTPAQRLWQIEYEKKLKDEQDYKDRTEKSAVEGREKEEQDRTLATKVIFQSDVNNLYLHFDDGKTSPGIPNLRYAGDYSFGIETRHEVVPQAGDTGLIHILCLKNNKYWSVLEEDGNKWITAMADNLMEECTLFRPVYGFSNKKKSLKLQHVNTGHYVRLFQGSGQYDGCLYLYPKIEDVETFTFIDWKKVGLLPDYIRIKGDNGNHLKAGGDGYMGCHHKADNYPPVFDFEVSPSRDGGVRLKSAYYDKYWTDMDDSEWVLLKEASTTTHETNTVFIPTGNVGGAIQIRSLKSGKFCKILTSHGKELCLATQRSYIDDWANMKIEEPVNSRVMTDYKYDFEDARAYDDRVTALVTGDVKNKGRETSMTDVIKLRHSVTNTTNWNVSHAVKVGFQVTASPKIPVVGSTGFTFSTDYTFTKENGGVKEETQEIAREETVIVPPMTRKVGTLVERRCSYDIPYTYNQTDNLKTGRTKGYLKHGICKLDYGYKYDIEVVDLPFE